METHKPLAAHAQKVLSSHYTIESVTITDTDHWYLEWTETVDTETETRGPDGPFMREGTEVTHETEDGYDLHTLVDALQQLRRDEVATSLELLLPLPMARQL